MRDIKFRAWDNVLCCMYTPDMGPNMWRIKDSMNGFVKYPDGVLMQFTGLKDRHGKEIYEGDIIQLESYSYHHLNKYFYEVYYNSDDMRFKFRNNQAFPTNYDYDSTGFHSFKVIGNIYENSELLTK